MDFDHREGVEKRFNVSAGIVHGFAIETIREEADKCDLVCAICHRMRTFARMERDRIATPARSAAPCAERTHCPQGHPYAGGNLKIRRRRGGLSRECVFCVRERDKARNLDRRKRKINPQE